MTADLATLRALAKSTVDASFAEARGWSDKCAVALLLACDEIATLRARVVAAPAPSAPPPPPPGFIGERGAVLFTARDGDHFVALVNYAFPDGSVVTYAELHETHDGARPGRVMAVSTLVHLAQNATDAEVWAIGNREPTT